MQSTFKHPSPILMKSIPTASTSQNRIPTRLVASLAFAFGSLYSASAQTSYTSNSATGAWNTARWNNSADGPSYTGTFTANNAVSFTSGNYSFSGMGAVINIGNISLSDNVNVTFTGASNSIATNGNVRTITVGTGSVLNFGTQDTSTTAGTGFIKNGPGVLFSAAGTSYGGGFTLNAGTVVAGGVNAFGNGASHNLTLNGGTFASNGNRAFNNTKFGGGIVIGGNVQFGELATVVSLASSSANLSFANNVSLGSATRTFTLGNNGTQTFSGVIANTSGNLTFAANANTDSGRFELTNTANTFTGEININGGEVRFTTDGSIGNAANDIVIDGGRFSKASDATTVTLGAGRTISIGDGVGTSISSPGSGNLTYNGAITNKTGETGSWAKQGGGVLELGGVSTYTGNTSVNNGTLRLTTGNDRLPTGTVVSLGQAASTNLGTLDLNGRSQEIAGLNSTTGLNATSGNNTVTSSTSATLTLGGAGTYSYGDGTNANSGVITGSIAVVKSGNGTQTFGDANTYSGGTTINGGTLVANHNNALGSGGVTINTGGTLSVGSGVTIGNTISLLGGTLSLSGGTYSPTLAAATNFTTVAPISSNFAGGTPDTTATLLGGTAGAIRTVATGFSGTSLAVNDIARRSDVFSLTGTGTDIFVLQLSVSGPIPTGSYLGWLDGSNTWVNAIDGNSSVGAFAVQGFAGSFAASGASATTDYLGSWGFDLAAGKVWAVLNHNSDFAAIPEPSTSGALAGLGMIGVALYRRRRQAAKAQR